MRRPWANLGADVQVQLRLQADTAKRHLSAKDRYSAQIKLNDGIYTVDVTKQMFEDAAAPLLERLNRPIERCFYDSGEGIEALDRVTLVGGATRMPMIRQLVARQFKMLTEMTIDPDYAVALGAAVQGGLVAEDRALHDVVMTDVSPFSVGIETATKLPSGQVIGGFFQPIIERNTPLPASRQNSFCTMENNQTELKVDVYQGEAPKVRDNVSLGSFRIKVPKAKAGKEGMDVRITYDPSGLIDVEATNSKGQQESIVIRENVSGLTEAEIETRLKQMARLKLHPREDEENLAFLARIRRLYEMASGDDRSLLQRILMEFEGALEAQDGAVIGKMRGEMSGTLDAIDDYYVS